MNPSGYHAKCPIIRIVILKLFGEEGRCIFSSEFLSIATNPNPSLLD